ncbi:MAG TPA: ComEC/Rec2 family competence protein, partial [Candidatus Polarisedimenticolia bacterium]
MRPPVVALPSRAGLRALLAALSAAVGSTLWRRPSQALGIAAPAHVMLLLLLAALSPRRGSGGGRVRPGRDLLLPFLAGLIAAALHQTLDPAPALLRAWVGAGYDPFSTPVALRVRLLDRQDLADERQAFTVELLQARPAGPLRPEETPVAGVRARLTLGRTPSLQPAAFRVGDLLDLTARLGPPRRFRNPGSFDYATYLEARGIALVGTIKSPFLVRRVRRPVFSWRRLLSEGREAIVASLDRSTAGKDPATASFLAALLVGEREELSPPLEQALIRSGVYHVVALSGLNVAVVALLCGMLLRPLPIAAPLRRLALLLAILLYAGLARDSGSMVRAALMATLYLTGALAGRRVSVLGAAGVAGWLIVLWRPAYLEDAGFQLSMAATLGLMLYGPPAAPPRPGRRPVSLFFIVDHLRRSVRLSGAALAATTLLTGLHFQRLAPVALLANLIAVPIANLLLVLALAIALCFPFIPVAGSALAGAAAPLITLLASVVTSLSAWPGASFQVLPPPPALVIFTGDILILGGLVTRRRIRSAALAIVILSSACVALRGRGGLPQGSLEVTALDVGQGGAILVRLP